MVAREAITKLSLCDLPVRIGYKVMKLKVAIERELNLIETARRKAIEKYGEKVKDTLKVKPENYQVFTDEMNTFLSEKADLNAFPVHINDISEARISPADIEALLPFLDGVEPPPVKSETETIKQPAPPEPVVETAERPGLRIVNQPLTAADGVK